MKNYFWFLTVLCLVIIVATVTVLVIVFLEKGNNETVDENEELFQLSIIHINDFHARFEETNEQSLPCREGQKCIGGFARMKIVVDQLKNKRKNWILLNAGDNFQGSFWYNLLRYNVTSHFLNHLQADATTLGNHEFAHRVDGLVPFLQTLESPVVVANIDDSHEPSIQKLYKKSIIVERSGRRIGIIGVILRETSSIANTDRLRFTDEAQAIRDESTRLRQAGVNIIVVLSHCGLDRDKEIALATGDFVDVIVGGHSHHFLYTSKDKTHPGTDRPAGPYPVVVTPKSGTDRKVLIVQAAAFTKFVGDLTVYFNAAGHVKYYDGNPVYLDTNIEMDSEIEDELKPWRNEVDRLGRRVVGHTLVSLANTDCWMRECALGSFAADAFVHETQLVHPELLVFASIIQSSGMRSSFPQGDITYGDVVSFMPFENTLDFLQLTGEVLIDVFEHSVSRTWDSGDFNHMLQVSGFQLTFNRTKPVGQRLQTIQIMASGGFENINPHKLYSVIVPSFLAGGGDGFTMIKTNRKHHRVGLLDIDIIERYIERSSPIAVTVDGRIVVLS